MILTLSFALRVPGICLPARQFCRNPRIWHSQFDSAKLDTRYKAIQPLQILCQYRNHSHADNKSVIAAWQIGQQKPSFVDYPRACWLLDFVYVQLCAAMADTHSHLPTTPCDIRLEFGNDERGMPSVGYKLSLQIKNRTARDIAGVSVYWLDDSLCHHWQ
jgi:hypothetical protein